jgi:hypothetical protein
MDVGQLALHSSYYHGHGTAVVYKEIDLLPSLLVTGTQRRQVGREVLITEPKISPANLTPKAERHPRVWTMGRMGWNPVGLQTSCMAPCRSTTHP